MASPRIMLLALCFAGAVLSGNPAFAAPGVVIKDPVPFPPIEASHPTQADDQLPKVVKRVDVVYPPELAARGIGDRVFVAFIVDSTGAVNKARPIFGGHPECEAAAVAAVEKWTFSPGRHMGKPVSTQMTVEIGFVLDTTRPSRD